MRSKKDGCRLVILWVATAITALGQSTITLSPGGISLRGTAGGTVTQNFTISNGTSVQYRFAVEVMDVLVQDGQRKFVTAGLSTGSAAALAVVPREPVTLGPGAGETVPVTFAIPRDTDIRAVAVFFRGEPVGTSEFSRLRLNLGAVVDFSVSDQVQLEGKPLQVGEQTSTSNVRITEELANVGREPAMARGIAAILDDPGKLVGKAVFEQKRLLPHEHNELHAEYAGTLQPGKYRIVCSFEYGGKTMTRTAQLVVQ